MRKSKWILVAVAAQIFLFVSACGGNEKKGPPTVTTEGTAVTAYVGESADLPSATASDPAGGDLSDQIRVSVSRDADGTLVYPASDAEAGILLSEADFVPSAEGDYTVRYFVKNSQGQTGEAEVKLTAKNRVMNAVSDEASWVRRNAGLDEDGYLALGAPTEQEEEISALPSVVYKGRRIGSGDLVTIRYNAGYLDGGVSTWYMNFGLTPADGTAEGGLPEELSNFLTLELMQNKIQIKSFGGTVNEYQFGTLDGRDHTISIRMVASAARLTFSFWLDTDPTETTTGTVFVSKTDVEEKLGADGYDKALFDPEEFGGYFTLFGSRSSLQSADDVLLVKGFTVNGAAPLTPPVLEAEAPESVYTLNQAIDFLQATARDVNEDADLSSAVQVFVTDPAGQTTQITGAYTPLTVGLYTLKYRVADRSGNITVKTFSFSVAKAVTTQPPTVVVEGREDGDTVTSTVMQNFTLPSVTKCEDANGDDLTSELRISVKGPMNFDGLANGAVIKPLAVGTYTVVYEVTDYSGNETKVELILNVEADSSKSGNQLLANPGDFTLGDGSEIVNDNLVMYHENNATFTYTGQMIYGEKVSMLVNWTMASSEKLGPDKWDGTYIYMINMRGGTVNAGSLAWPDGLIMHLDPYDSITIQKAGHNSGIIARLTLEPLRDTFQDKDVLLQWQITDVLDAEGNVEQYLIQVWLNGVRVGSSELPWTYADHTDEQGNFIVRGSTAAVQCPNITKAGWMQVAAYKADLIKLQKNYVKYFSIDGEYVETKVEVTGEVNEIGIGKTYTLPDVTITFDGVAATEVVRTLYLGDSETGVSQDADSFPVTEEHKDGFTVTWAVDGLVYYTSKVRVTGSVEEVVWSASTENIRTETGTASALPAVSSARVSGETVTDGFTYTVAYASGYTVSGLTAAELAAYRPAVKGNYTVTAFLEEIKVGSYSVTNTSGLGDLADTPFGEGDTYSVFYTGELLWENTVTMQVKFSSFGTLSLPIRGGMAYAQTNGTGETELGGLFLRISNGRAEIVGNTTVLAAFNLPANFTSNGSHMIAYRVVNNWNEDKTEILTISVTLWLDGVMIRTADDRSEAVLQMSAIKDFGGSEPAALYGKQFPGVEILSMFVNDEDGTRVTPFVSADTDYSAGVLAAAGIAKKLPVLTKVFGNFVSSAELTVEGTAITSPYAFPAAGTFRVLYTFSDQTTQEVTVTVIDPAGKEKVFAFTGPDGANETVDRDINAALNVPFTYTIDGKDFTSDVTAELVYNNYKVSMTGAEALAYRHDVRQDFVLNYLYAGEVVGSKKVHVTGTADGNVVTPAANATGGGASADEYWSGTLSPSFRKEKLYDFTASFSLDITKYGYIRISLRGDFPINPTYGYDWPTNYTLCLDDQKRLYFLHGDPLCSTSVADIWNENLTGTVYITVQVQDVMNEDGSYAGTYVKFYLNGQLIQMDDPSFHRNQTLEDGYTLWVDASRGDIIWEEWNEPCNFGLFHTTSFPWTLREVYFDGTVLTPTAGGEQTLSAAASEAVLSRREDEM